MRLDLNKTIWKETPESSLEANYIKREVSRIQPKKTVIFQSFFIKFANSNILSHPYANRAKLLNFVYQMSGVVTDNATDWKEFTWKFSYRFLGNNSDR